MLTIRREQMGVFRLTAYHHFEEEMVLHIKQFTPRHAKIVGEASVRRVVGTGIERAKEYGLTNRGPVRFFIECMFMFGSDFDTDPQYPWNGEILNDPNLLGQMERGDRLYDKVMDYVDKVIGVDYILEEEAIKRASALRFQDVQMPEVNFEGELLSHLKHIYPQKYEYVGDPALQALIRGGNELAKTCAISLPVGVAVLVGLMFTFGHGCVSDPQFPWMAKALHNASIVDPNKRIERLYSKMITYLRYGLKRGLAVK